MSTGVLDVPTEPGDRDPSAAPSTFVRPFREPDLRLEGLDVHLSRGGASFPAGPLSLAAHGAGLAAILLVPLFRNPELPEPTRAVRAFFVGPTAAPPPPPPPPPASRPALARPADLRPQAETPFTAPAAMPDAVRSEEGLDLAPGEGIPGGVEGGVEGGVVGGVVGGLHDEPPPPVVPVRVGGQIKEPRKVKHVPPVYPEAARQARLRGAVIVEAVIGPDGRVHEARLLRGVPLLDAAALEAVRQWVYTPTLVSGVPVPVVMTITVSFNLAER